MVPLGHYGSTSGFNLWRLCFLHPLMEIACFVGIANFTVRKVIHSIGCLLMMLICTWWCFLHKCWCQTAKKR